MIKYLALALGLFSVSCSQQPCSVAISGYSLENRTYGYSVVTEGYGDPDAPSIVAEAVMNWSDCRLPGLVPGGDDVVFVLKHESKPGYAMLATYSYIPDENGSVVTVWGASGYSRENLVEILTHELGHHYGLDDVYRLRNGVPHARRGCEKHLMGNGAVVTEELCRDTEKLLKVVDNH